jgi:hypothetical protein
MGWLVSYILRGLGVSIVEQNRSICRLIQQPCIKVLPYSLSSEWCSCRLSPRKLQEKEETGASLHVPLSQS